MAQRGGGQPVAARRATNSEIDPAGIEGVEYPELLGYLEGGVVVAQHYAAAADANRVRVGRDLAYEYLRTRASEGCRVVVLGDPVPAVPEIFRALGELYGLPERVRGMSSLTNGETGSTTLISTSSIAAMSPRLLPVSSLFSGSLGIHQSQFKPIARFGV